MRLILTILCFSFSSLFAQTSVNFYGNPSGNNGNAGTSTGAAKRTLQSLDTLVNASVIDTVTVNLAGNSTFSGTDGLYLKRGKVFVKSYNPSGAGNYNFPILKGTDNFTTGWTLTGSNTWYQNIPNSITLGINYYAYMYVVEVDTLLEHTAPYTARRYLTRVASQAAVDTTEGSYYSPASIPVSPIIMYLHTSDGVSPNNHPSYRYEVVTRDRAINRNLGGGFGSYVNVDKLITIDYGQGTGNIASRQDSFIMTRSVILGNTIHQGVYGMKSIIDKCLFIGGDMSLNGGSIIFYQIDGSPHTSTISNTTFLDAPSVFYTHTSFGMGDGIHIGRVNFHGNYVFNTLSKVIESVAYLDTMDINYLYVKDCNSFERHNLAGISYLNNVVAQNTNIMIQQSQNNFLKNCLYTSKTTQIGIGVIISAQQKIDIQNSVFHFQSTNSIGAGTMFREEDTSCRVTSLRNIFVINILQNAYTELATANNNGGAGTGPDIHDYNAYVLVSGNPIWKVTNHLNNGGDFSVFTFNNWKIQSGQDAHSIMIDLRGNPNGINQIFVNADAGDYRLADTPQADSIMAIGAGMSTPLRTFVNAPTREQAVSDVEQNRFTPVRNLFIPPPSGMRRIGNLNFTQQ
jgi:hypothetical protein